jgi:hypothetical protein
MRALPVLAGLLALAAAGSGVHPSQAAFTSSARNPANTITTASDWVAPAVTVTSPAEGAFVTDTTPTIRGAAGTATGDSSTISVRIYSGTAAIGTPVQTRTATRWSGAWSTTAGTLADGTYTVAAIQTDTGSNTGTDAATFTIDTTAPTPTSISAANRSGGVKGRLGAGDSITYTFSEAIAPASVLSTFAGGSTTANVQVFFYNNGSADYFGLLDGNGQQNVKLDVGVATNAELVTANVTWPATMTQSSDGKSFTVTLGTAPGSGLATTSNSNRNMAWNVNDAPEDRAGHGLSTTGTVTETDNDQDF